MDTNKSVFSATYRDGAFHPDEPCDLPEGTRAMVGEILNGVSPALEPDPVEMYFRHALTVYNSPNPTHRNGLKMETFRRLLRLLPKAERYGSGIARCTAIFRRFVMRKGRRVR